MHSGPGSIRSLRHQRARLEHGDTINSNMSITTRGEPAIPYLKRLTVHRRTRLLRYARRAVANVEELGAVNSPLWKAGILAEINEPGVISERNLTEWMDTDPQFIGMFQHEAQTNFTGEGTASVTSTETAVEINVGAADKTLAATGTVDGTAVPGTNYPHISVNSVSQDREITPIIGEKYPYRKLIQGFWHTRVDRPGKTNMAVVDPKSATSVGQSIIDLQPQVQSAAAGSETLRMEITSAGQSSKGGHNSPNGRTHRVLPMKFEGVKDGEDAENFQHSENVEHGEAGKNVEVVEDIQVEQSHSDDKLQLSDSTAGAESFEQKLFQKVLEKEIARQTSLEKYNKVRSSMKTLVVDFEDWNETLDEPKNGEVLEILSALKLALDKMERKFRKNH